MNRNNEVAAHRPLLAGGRGSQGSPRFVAHTLLRVVGHCSCLHGEVEGDNPAIQAQQDKVQVLKVHVSASVLSHY